MKLEEVLPALRAGKMIRRANFMNKLVFLLRDRNNVAVACYHGKNQLAFAKDYVRLWSNDLLAEDWEVLE